MIFALLIGLWFFRIAKKGGLIAGLWAAIGVLSYIVGQLIAVALMMYADPNLNDDMQVLVPGIIGGLVGTGIAFGILQNAVKNKGQQNKTGDDNLLDDKTEF